MIYQLSHHKLLKLQKISKNYFGSLDSKYISASDEMTDVITLRHIPFSVSFKKIKKVRATERWLDFSKKKVLLIGLYSDTPFVQLIIWDVVHSLDVGGIVEIHEDDLQETCLDKEYYSSCFEKVALGSGLSYRKLKKLPIETDSGLNDWTFGIPTGPDDPTLLNAVVERILEIDVPHKEIILCGRPHPDFKYFNQVRIVGEDITAPPVKICAKKNRLAQEAKYSNLCIIHDRVFLPTDFGDAIRKFGDFYPLTTLQSLFFDDRYNAVPRRYSDVGISYKAKVSPSRGLMRDMDLRESSIFSPGVFALTESSGFYAANAIRFSEGMYPTGSMYICKKAIWNRFPQNESLNWIEFEDLEHAYRAYQSGVPTRVNPHAITQSLISRPLLGRIAGTYLVMPAGIPSLYRAWTECLPLARKPLIKVSHATALNNLRKFAAKYMTKDLEYTITQAAVTHSPTRIKTLVDIMSRIEFKIQDSVVSQLISDFEKMVLCDQLPFGTIEGMKNKILANHENPVNVFVLDNDILLNHLANRPKKSVFYGKLSDYFVKNGARLVLGSMVSALGLYLKKYKVLYLQGGILTYYRAIRNTTPFIRGDE